jgi:hypothetical protein
MVVDYASMGITMFIIPATRLRAIKLFYYRVTIQIDYRYLHLLNILRF